MMKWFETVDLQRPAIVSSRVRLVRNWDKYSFPSKFTDDESRQMIGLLESGLKNLGQLDGRTYHFARLEELNELDRKVMKDRRVISAATAVKKSPVALFVSENEDTGIVLNGDDHIRIQLFSAGFHLQELWKRADELDNYINKQFPYAFDEKYGYLTSFPTNVGTGLRVSVLMHLPALSTSKKFNGLIAEMGRFGVVVKGGYGEENENHGSLFELSNQKTLGVTEKEIIDSVSKVALQLSQQEMKVRKMTQEKHALMCADETYKSYGVMKYARRMSEKDAMIFLSQFLKGMADGVVKTATPCSVYRLMLGIKPSNLQKLSDHPLGKEEMEIARATYLRAELPEII